jgi:DNA-binding IclR family transcriptional regulator
MIQSVKRATDIISLFSSSRTALGITQIAGLLNLNKATTWGLVSTLEKQGFLQQDPETSKYGVGAKLFELGMVYLGNLEVNAKASRSVHELANRTGFNSRVGIWDGGTVLITLLALPKSEDSLSHQLGPRVPAYCSGVGKALLAYLGEEELQKYLQETELIRHTRTTIVTAEELLDDLKETRERGYSISAEEMIPGVVALGAPIFDRTKRPVGSISLSVAGGKDLDRMADEVLRTAAEISQKMGFYIDMVAGAERRPEGDVVVNLRS